MYCLTQSLNTVKRNLNSINTILFIILLCTISLFVYKLNQTKTNSTNICTRMEEEHFYLHLQSNVGLVSPLQVGNTIGNFVTHLSRKLNLSDEWEVGLTDIQYSKTWFNIMRDEYVNILFSDDKLHRDEYNNYKEYKFLVLNAGNYNSPEDICLKINEAIKYNLNLHKILEKNMLLPPKLKYMKDSNKIIMKFGLCTDEGFAYIHFSDFLASMLGFLDSQGRQYPIGFEPSHPWWAVKTARYDKHKPPLAAMVTKTSIELQNPVIRSEDLPGEFKLPESTPDADSLTA